MPCRDYPQESYRADPRAQFAVSAAATHESAMKAKRETEDKFTPLLCSACRALERLGYDFDENPALSVWWTAHKDEDAAREEAAAREAARKAYRAAKVAEVMAKPFSDLTADDKALLREEGML